MAEPIRISAMGRDAQVGDLYNYFTDAIIPSWIDVPNGRKTISNTVGDPELLFLYQQPENCKLHLLGINSHLLQNMNRGSVPGHQLWFDFYLNTNSMDGDEEHAQVTLLFRVVRRTETLDLDLLRSKIDDYQIISADESATHVIDEVVYGAELICSIRKALDLSQETKESAEVSIYFAAKKYLDDTIGKSTSLELPAELDQVSCTVLSSIEPGKKNEMYFDSFNLYLQNLLNTGNNRQKWKPMEFRLQNMSVALIEAKLWSERKADIALEKEHHQVSIKWISKDMLDISNDPSLKRFPLLETFICYFRNLLPRFWKGIDEAYETFEMLPEEKALEEMTYISDWLKRVMDLFACRRKDIREMCWLLKDTDLILQDMQVIEAQMKTKDCKIAKLFFLNLEYKQVPIVNDIEELVGQQTSTAMLPVLPIFSYEKEQIGCIRSALSQFENEARLAKLSSAHGTSYYVGLESSMLENGAVKIVDYSGISPVIISEDNLVEYLQKKQKHQLPTSSSSVSACLPTPLIPTAASNNQTPKRSISRKEQIGTRAESNKPNLRFEQISLYETNVTEPSTSTEDKSNGQNPTVNRSKIAQVRDILQYRKSNLQPENVIQHREKYEGIIEKRGLRVDKIGVWNRNGDQNSTRNTHGNTEPNENRRIAEIYIDKMDVDPYLSDVESIDGDCSQEKTGSTKIKSSTKDSAKTSITSKDQIEPEKSERNSSTAQPKLYGANVTEQSTSFYTPVQKNVNSHGSMERNSIVNNTIIRQNDTETFVMFPSQAEGMTEPWDKSDGIRGGRGNTSIKVIGEIDPFEDENVTRHSKTNSSKKDQTGIRSAPVPEETILNFEPISLHDTNATKPSTSAAAPDQKNFNDGRSKERDVIAYESRRVQVPEKVGETKKFDFDADKDYTTYRNMEPHDNRRIAEIYADESSSYSNLIRKGSPKVYLLNATKKSNSEKINWFDICRPGDPMRSRNSKNHKIIILMGATRSGKSTLINGMINYILGVKWNDPFRFKCVREDENATRNQAHSQTSSVTAYTLHRQEGMTIPYSITIIDTPGYGDTRGVKRDKEITANIHRFLTQEKTRINDIHAACFVAASGDSRLTATQRYIIDSVLSIFGKDMKNNLRLLVTFADNADPPVVEACGAAHFPATSASAGISYSKFNSSVLYCSNATQENEFCFDELFWDMGQENFHKFFTMLGKMDARNLTSTREVIQRRQQLEQSLKDIESELEICLVNIEEMEKFRQQLREYGRNMETNKNFVVERTEMRPVKVDCDKGLLAFNCNKCTATCEKPSQKKFKNRICTNEFCTCSKSAHEVQPFTWISCPVKIKTTLNEMKAQFESNANRKFTTQELMEDCLEELNIANAKVLSLLDQVGANARSLDSTALRSNALNPSEYLSLMRSRVLEEQAPGYLTRLQTLTELQQRFDASGIASAKKGQSSGSNVTTQTVISDNTSRGRGRPWQTSAHGPANASESKSNGPGRNGWDQTLSQSSQIPHPSGGQVTAPTAPRYETRSQTQRNMNGTNHFGPASTTSCYTQTYGRSRGRGRGYPANQTDTAASVIHGTDCPWKHPPGSPEEYYINSVKASQSPWSNDGGWQNPDGSSDAASGPSSLVQGNTRHEPKVIPSFNHPGDDKGTYSSGNENKKTEKKSEDSEGVFASARRSFFKYIWPST